MWPPPAVWGKAPTPSASASARSRRAATRPNAGVPASCPSRSSEDRGSNAAADQEARLFRQSRSSGDRAGASTVPSIPCVSLRPQPSGNARTPDARKQIGVIQKKLTKLVNDCPILSPMQMLNGRSWVGRWRPLLADRRSSGRFSTILSESRAGVPVGT